MTARRICTEHRVTYTDRCPICRTTRYDHEHTLLRQRWEPIVALGNTPCARDRSHNIDPAEPWHLDHLDDGTRAPSCSRHNIAATRNIEP